MGEMGGRPDARAGSIDEKSALTLRRGALSIITPRRIKSNRWRRCRSGTCSAPPRCP